MRTTRYILFSLLCVLLTGCPMDIWYAFNIVNNSNQTIDVCAAYVFPDTLLPVNKPDLIEIKPIKIGNLHGYHFNDDTFERFKKERLTIFILDKKDVDTYSWEYLREHDMVLKRYVGSANDFPFNNGLTIHYP